MNSWKRKSRPLPMPRTWGNHINQCLHCEIKGLGTQQLTHLLVPWQHRSGPELCHVPPPCVWPWPGCRGGGRWEGRGGERCSGWGRRVHTVDKGDDKRKYSYYGPRLWPCNDDDDPADSRPCVGGWGWRGRDIGRRCIPDGNKRLLPVVTLRLWRSGKSEPQVLELLAGPHYPIMSEVSHQLRVFFLFQLSLPPRLKEWKSVSG